METDEILLHEHTVKPVHCQWLQNYWR